MSDEIHDHLHVITIVWDSDDDSIDVSWEGLNGMEARGVLLSTLDVVRQGLDDGPEEDDEEL